MKGESSVEGALPDETSAAAPGPVTSLAGGPQGIGEADVVSYLEAHPDFFEGHPEVAEQLLLTHPVGGAVSLIEYQIRVLKDSNQDLRVRLKNLVTNARENEEIGRRVHRLCLHLLQCNGVDEIFGRLYQHLAEEFNADFAAVRLFVPPGDSGDGRLGEFAALSESASKRLHDALRPRKPLCGKLEDAMLEPLFGERTSEIGSCALVPLGEGKPIGVLAVASRTPSRFRKGTGTIFIAQIGEIVSHALMPFLERD